MFLGAVRAAGSAGKGNQSAAPSDNEVVLQLYLTSLQLLHHPLPLHYWIFAAVKEPGRGFLLCRRKICSCCENRRKLSTPLPRLAKEQEEGPNQPVTGQGMAHPSVWSSQALGCGWPRYLCQVSTSSTSVLTARLVLFPQDRSLSLGVFSPTAPRETEITQVCWHVPHSAPCFKTQSYQLLASQRWLCQRD